jgi:hypothetical protein
MKRASFPHFAQAFQSPVKEPVLQLIVGGHAQFRGSPGATSKIAGRVRFAVNYSFQME